jgi:RNA polymerase sigma-70 factor (ECF subfamily)
MSHLVETDPAMSSGDRVDLDLDTRLQSYRVELTGYCYRMLGSAFVADDAVQETFERAWRGYDRFEGRAPLRSWLYRIATNVCINMLNGRKRRALPMDLTSPSPGDAALRPPLPEHVWLEPFPDWRADPAGDDPGELVASRETIRLAFVAALQYLPARQRAVLILRDVLRWRTAEVADLLDTTVVSVKSALQRARAALAARAPRSAGSDGLSEKEKALLDRYVDAFERYDVDELVTLLHREATLSMPPHPTWLRGVDAIHRWWLNEDTSCRGSRLVPVAANGSPAFAQYRPDASTRDLGAFAIQVLNVTGEGIRAIDTFVSADLFRLFELPLRIDR